jgi:hypothetical protein
MSHSLCRRRCLKQQKEQHDCTKVLLV